MHARLHYPTEGLAMSVSALQRAAAPHIPTPRPGPAAVGAPNATTRTNAVRPVPTRAIAPPKPASAAPSAPTPGTTHVETSLDHHDLFANKPPQNPNPVTSGSDGALEEQKRRQREGSLGPGVMTEPLLTAPIASATQGAASVQDREQRRDQGQSSSSTADDTTALPDQAEAGQGRQASATSRPIAMTMTPSMAQAMYSRALGGN